MLFSSSPVIEGSILVTIKVESRSQTPSLRFGGAGINIACRLCMHYIDDHYHIMHHDNHATTGDVVKFFIIIIIFIHVGC